MHVHFWGVRGDIALAGPQTVKYGGHTLCATVTDSHGILCILDAGSGLTALGNSWGQEENKANPENVLFLISHSHWSHTQGIGFFPPFFRTGFKFTFYGLGRDEMAFHDILEAQLDPALSPLQTLNHLAADLAFREPDVAGFQWDRIEVHPLVLRTGTRGYDPLAYRLKAKGRTLVYIPQVEYTDCRLDDRVIDFSKGANLLIHEAYHSPDEQYSGSGHASARQATELALKANVEHLVLFHYNPAYDDGRIDRMIQRCRGLAEGSALTISGAREGLCLPV